MSSPVGHTSPLLSGAFGADIDDEQYGSDYSEDEAEGVSAHESPDPQTELRDAVRGVYEEDRHFHGTTEEAKESIVQNGFVKDHKDGGAFQQFAAANPESLTETSYSEAKSNTDTHHYLAADKESAEDYAKLAAESKQAKPAMVRTIGVNQEFKLRRDPDGRSSAELRTSSDIPASYVLGSKKSAPGPNAAIFKSSLERNGISVSEERAGELLRDVQSDSEDDDLE